MLIVFSRPASQAAANGANANLFNIEIICSNPHEHKLRVETGITDIPDLIPPNWQSVQQRQYEPWTTERPILDSATLTPREALAVIQNHLGAE